MNSQTNDRRMLSLAAGALAPRLSDDELKQLAADGRKLRKRFEARVAPMKTLSADDLRIRAR